MKLQSTTYFLADSTHACSVRFYAHGDQVHVELFQKEIMLVPKVFDKFYNQPNSGEHTEELARNFATQAFNDYVAEKAGTSL